MLIGEHYSVVITQRIERRGAGQHSHPRQGSGRLRHADGVEHIGIGLAGDHRAPVVIHRDPHPTECRDLVVERTQALIKQGQQVIAHIGAASIVELRQQGLRCGA